MSNMVITIKKRCKNGRFKEARSFTKYELFEKLSSSMRFEKPTKPFFVSKKRWAEIESYFKNKGKLENLIKLSCIIDNKAQTVK